MTISDIDFTYLISKQIGKCEDNVDSCKSTADKAFKTILNIYDIQTPRASENPELPSSIGKFCYATFNNPDEGVLTHVANQVKLDKLQKNCDNFGNDANPNFDLSKFVKCTEMIMKIELYKTCESIDDFSYFA